MKAEKFAPAGCGILLRRLDVFFKEQTDTNEYTGEIFRRVIYLAMNPAAPAASITRPTTRLARRNNRETGRDCAAIEPLGCALRVYTCGRPDRGDVGSMVVVSLLFRLRAEETATAAGAGCEQAWAAAISGVHEAMRVAGSARRLSGLAR